MQIEKATVINLLKTLKSGIALDIAPNHTGIVEWDGEKTIEHHFVIGTYDKNELFGEAKMRRAFKEELRKIVDDKAYQVVVVEDWYVGENADTVRKLAALNTVIDDLILDRVCLCEEFYRWKESEWHSRAMMIAKQQAGLKSKYKTQALLEELEYAYYLQYADASDKIKQEVCLEDVCDACGMLLAVVADKLFKVEKPESRNIKLSDIKMHFIDGRESVGTIKGMQLQEDDLLGVPLDYKNLENAIKRNIKSHPDSVLISPLPVSKLGLFGINNKFTFFDSDDTYLVYYLKKKKQDKQ